MKRPMHTLPSRDTFPSRDRKGAQPPPDAAQNKKRIARSAADRRRQLRDSSEALTNTRFLFEYLLP
jgi:hypothetical protein